MHKFNRFKKGNNIIYYGDVLKVLTEVIDDSSIDLIFADPPYNIGKKFANFKDKWPSDRAYIDWCEKWLILCIAKLKPSGSLYIMSSTQCMPYLDLFLREQLHVLSRIVWHYDSSGVQARHYFGSIYEPILYCVKDNNNYVFNADAIKVEAKTGAKRKLIDYRKNPPAVYNSSKVPGNAWYFPRVRFRMPEYEKHPSQKPEVLLERIVKASSNEGDCVLDLFSGSFTTSAVAQRLHRKTIGIESQEDYIKIGLRRLGIAKTYKGETLHSVDKKTVKRNG